jgi:DNA-binding winged helix-turn-helix (wHTH) protein/tetratricopeptide (TPR) repeat protein
MSSPTYRFRNFRLDPRARELYMDDELVALPVSTIDCLVYLIRNRERSVGRDELVAAVWGRVDASEVSLSHAIMRLRRLLGDTGNEQNSIRTLPRLGYRWIVEPTFEVADAQPAAAEPQAAPAVEAKAPAEAPVADPPIPAPAPLRRRSLRVLGLSALALTALIGLAAILVLRRPAAPPAEKPAPAMVLPAEVEASGDWAWVRLGFMDLIANRLRKGNLVTTPSESVLGLINAHRLDAGIASDTAATGARALLIQPRATFANAMWNVRLEARGDGRDLIAEARAPDVLAAGRAAADQLLVKLGLTPPPSEETDQYRAAEELDRRVSAAVLSGQLDVARALIKDAPPAVQASPEIGLSTAVIEFFAGEYEASRKHAEAVLDQLPADKNPRLRARALNRLGVALVRLGRDAEADAAFVQVIQLLRLRNDPDALAAAYTGRGVVAGQAQRLDEAAAFFGQARVLHEMSNDAFGVARVDLNLGAVAMDRGQPAIAAPIFSDAADRFQNLATPEALNSALRSLADAQSMLLEHDKALATTERFWPVESHSRNPREGWWLTLSRAVALAGVGRLHDADDLIARIRTASDPAEDAVARVEADALAADLALLRGDDVQAAALAAKALTPALESTNWLDYESTLATRIRALQRGGDIAAAAAEIRRLRTWAETMPGDRRMFYVELMEAEQARAEGRTDAALQRYADTLARAERIGIPEDIVAVGRSYVEALLAAGRIDQASAIGGRLAPWSAQDMRASWVQAQIYQTLRKDDAARVALERARRLAGERILPGDVVPQAHRPD